ncbi:MAG: hypothetical protein PHS44_03470 [Candidatus Dojkabacteria bacterium]|nr:hypothetical protein [Candidatus Dojkabacteria bacterium]
MKTVCLCNSFKFYRDQICLKKLLEEEGFEVLEPYPDEVFWKKRDGDIELRDLSKLSKEKGIINARRVSLRHFEKIDEADCVYVISKRGYVGNSVSMEIGYAYAKGRHIYSTEPIEDWPLAGMVSEVLGPEEFIKRLK